MGNQPSEIPPELKDFQSNKSKSFEVRIEHCGSWGMGQMYGFAADCISVVYPKAKITRNESPSRGQFLIFVKDKTGKEIETYNKNNGDGAFNEKTCLKAMEKIKNIVE